MANITLTASKDKHEEFINKIIKALAEAGKQMEKEGRDHITFTCPICGGTAKMRTYISRPGQVSGCENGCFQMMT